MRATCHGALLGAALSLPSEPGQAILARYGLIPVTLPAQLEASP